MFSQFTLKVFTIILAVVAGVLLVYMLLKPAPVAVKTVSAPPVAQLPPENPPPPGPAPAEVEKKATAEITRPQPAVQAAPPAPERAPSVPSGTEPAPVRSQEVPRAALHDTTAAAKTPGRFIVYMRDNPLSNGFSFSEMDDKFGMNSPGDIAWEFHAQPEELRGSAALKWFRDRKPIGYPMPLTEDMLQRKQIYPDMPEPGVWEIKLARPGEKDLLLFTFTILKEAKGARP